MFFFLLSSIWHLRRIVNAIFINRSRFSWNNSAFANFEVSTIILIRLIITNKVEVVAIWFWQLSKCTFLKTAKYLKQGKQRLDKNTIIIFFFLKKDDA